MSERFFASGTLPRQVHDFSELGFRFLKMGRAQNLILDSILPFFFEYVLVSVRVSGDALALYVHLQNDYQMFV